MYLIPEDFELSSWFSFGIGANLCLLAYLVQPALAAIFESHKMTTEVQGSTAPLFTLGGIKYFALTRAYLYIHSWAAICYWRGVWELIDLYLGKGWVNSLVLYVTCQLITVCTLTVRSILGAPLALQRDTDPDLLRSLTVFRVDVSA